jgi:hypothetical protein
MKILISVDAGGYDIIHDGLYWLWFDEIVIMTFHSQKAKQEDTAVSCSVLNYIEQTKNKEWIY